MYFDNRLELFNFISGKNIVIWGARMTGIGALRQLKEKKIKVLNFLDSDPSLVGNLVHGLKVHHPNDHKENFEQ
jgi:FlaA1/EpsC-like NDP-sugar epimerase